MRFLVANPTASLYNNRTQVLARLSLRASNSGPGLGVPVRDPRRALRDRVPFASYCFFVIRPAFGQGEVRTIDQLIEHRAALKQRFGFTSHKLKAGVFSAGYELEAYRALAASLRAISFRIRSEWSVVHRAGYSVRPGHRGHFANDYFEDPVYGLNGMRRTRQMVGFPWRRTRWCGTSSNSRRTFWKRRGRDSAGYEFWGGIRACVKAREFARRFNWESRALVGELGIPVGTMLHLGAALPNLSFAADAHYHHLTATLLKAG